MGEVKHSPGPYAIAIMVALFGLMMFLTGFQVGRLDERVKRIDETIDRSVDAAVEREKAKLNKQ